MSPWEGPSAGATGKPRLHKRRGLPWGGAGGSPPHTPPPERPEAAPWLTQAGRRARCHPPPAPGTRAGAAPGSPTWPVFPDGTAFSSGWPEAQSTALEVPLQIPPRARAPRGDCPLGSVTPAQLTHFVGTSHRSGRASTGSVSSPHPHPTWTGRPAPHQPHTARPGATEGPRHPGSGNRS